jgi:predicted dinucleotide-binding enzyme
MKIGIIGAGMIGGALARMLTKLGHEVAIANSRGPESLRALAAEAGARPVTPAEAARSGEIVSSRSPSEPCRTCRRTSLRPCPPTSS